MAELCHLLNALASVCEHRGHPQIQGLGGCREGLLRALMEALDVPLGGATGSHPQAVEWMGRSRRVRWRRGGRGPLTPRT